MASQTTNSPASGTPKKDSGKTAIQKNKFLYAGTIVLLAFSIVAFIFWGSNGGGDGSTGTLLEFGSYNGKAITNAPGNYFTKQVSLVYDALKQQGYSEQNFQLFRYQVYRQAFERTVVHMGFLDEIRKAGAVVSDDYVNNKLLENPSLQENGKVSLSRLRQMPEAEKLSLRAEIREESLLSEYSTDVMSISPSSKELDFVKAMGKQTRNLDYVAYPLSAYPDSEVSAWAAANTRLLRRLKMSRISDSSSEADAKKLLKQVVAGTLAFADAAKAHSTDSYADKGGSMGIKYFYEIQGDLEKKEDADMLASLKAGEYSAVLKTATGSWAFYRAEEAISEAPLADPVVLKDARAYIESYEKGKIEDWTIAQAKGLSDAPGAQFEASAKKLGLAVKTTGAFPINYGDLQFSAYGQTIPLLRSIDSKAAPELASASGNEAFLTATFSQAPGTVSQPLVLGDSVIVFKVKEAGAVADEELASLSLFYPIFFQQKVSQEVGPVFLKSPLFKDKFMDVFIKYLAPTQQ